MTDDTTAALNRIADALELAALVEYHRCLNEQAQWCHSQGNMSGLDEADAQMREVWAQMKDITGTEGLR